MSLPFCKSYLTGKELAYIQQIQSFSGDGAFTQRCHEWLQHHTKCHRAFLTHSCTAALEMAALLIDVQPGDEILMPSYTFVSTANAFVLRGGVPVFVDVRTDTFNINEKLIESAITEKTKAIVPVHYAGVAAHMEVILQIAKKHHLFVIEDAAQGMMAAYQGKILGTIGDFGAYSFHATKNIISGEGGALLLRDPHLVAFAEMIREKGTDRSRFFRDEVDKYTWQTLGSSYLPSELNAAFLFAQLEEAESITKRRVKIWEHYHTHLAHLEEKGLLRRPIVPENCQHNGHMYYILLENAEIRQKLMKHLQKENISSSLHFVPLHDSHGGKKYGRVSGEMTHTESVANHLLRLPLFYEMKDADIDKVIQAIQNFWAA